jgi:hypothetical protein
MIRLILLELRRIAVFVLCVGSAVGFGLFLDRHWPVRNWLFFRLIAIYGWQILLTCACASIGHLVVTELLGMKNLSRVATWAFSLPVGLVVFVWGMFVGGYLGLYGHVFAVALPLLMLAIGFRSTFRALRSLRAWPMPPRGFAFVVAVAGFICLFLMYLELISPDALNYDSAWSHLVVAQDYAREGRIVPFMADWNKNVPHLASVVQTWGFIVPGEPIDHPTRWMMALHTEFTMFVWTLVTVAAAANWFVGSTVRSAWAGMFLFPGFFVYDANLGGSSDHFLALFAAPTLLAAVLAAECFERGPCGLLAIVAAGALMTKLQAIYLIAPIAVMLAGRWAWLVARSPAKTGASYTRFGVTRGALLVLGFAAVIASPQFIENWVYFRNPVYPMMEHTFTKSRPSMPDMAWMADNLFATWMWHPPAEIHARMWNAFRRIFMFPFEPAFFYALPPNVGALHTLLMPLVPVLPNARRVWVGLLISMGSLFVWAMTFNSDRNLQGFLPVLVVVVIAIIVRAWRLGGIGRLGVALLVGFHTVWSADAFFSGSDRLQAGVSLIKSTWDGRALTRFDDYRRGYRDIGRALPKDALAVLHNYHVSLGINRRVLLDWVGFQGLIDYRTFKTPRDAYDRFAELGVTHVITVPGSRPSASKQEDVIFGSFQQYLTHLKDAGGLSLYEMPKTPPPKQEPLRVLALGMGNYSDGIYTVDKMGVCEEASPADQKYPMPDVPVAVDGRAAALEQVNAAIITPVANLDSKAHEVLSTRFHVNASYTPFSVYIRNER